MPFMYLIYLSSNMHTLKKIFFFLFWLHFVTSGILVPRPGIKPVSDSLEVLSVNHWTAKEVQGRAI